MDDVLVLKNAEMEEVDALPISEAVDVIEHAFAELGEGRAKNAPRSRIHVEEGGSPADPDTWYWFNNIMGAVPGQDAMALRIDSSLRKLAGVDAGSGTAEVGDGDGDSEEASEAKMTYPGDFLGEPRRGFPGVVTHRDRLPAPADRVEVGCGRLGDHAHASVGERVKRGPPPRGPERDLLHGASIGGPGKNRAGHGPRSRGAISRGVGRMSIPVTALVGPSRRGFWHVCPSTTAPKLRGRRTHLQCIDRSGPIAQDLRTFITSDRQNRLVWQT